MITKTLLLRIMDSANLRRWNDKICPVELRELDKQAHKMVIAYMLGKFDENIDHADWIKIIEGGIFEFLHRLVLTDLKPQIFHKIKNNREKFLELNNWVYAQISPSISPLGSDFCTRFKEYIDSPKETIHRRILNAAHFQATKWEFRIIQQSDPEGYEIDDISHGLSEVTRSYYDLTGMQKIMLYPEYAKFIDLCGQLRFQVRWSHLHRIPRTSVLGHSFIVALLSYLFSLQVNACPKRCINNFMTGLFHDLPEVLTRDIINPVKVSVEGLDDLIKSYEIEEMEEKIYKPGLIPSEWITDLKLYTENEFASLIMKDNKQLPASSDEINLSYNSDHFSPRDGEIVRAADHIAAFLEAWLARENGSPSQEFSKAIKSLSETYSRKSIAGIEMGEIYQQFHA